MNRTKRMVIRMAAIAAVAFTVSSCNEAVVNRGDAEKAAAEEAAAKAKAQAEQTNVAIEGDTAKVIEVGQ